MVSVRADGFGRRRTTFFCPNEEKNAGKIDFCTAKATCKKGCREKTCAEPRCGDQPLHKRPVFGEPRRDRPRRYGQKQRRQEICIAFDGHAVKTLLKEMPGAQIFTVVPADKSCPQTLEEMRQLLRR